MDRWLLSARRPATDDSGRTGRADEKQAARASQRPAPYRTTRAAEAAGSQDGAAGYSKKRASGLLMKDGKPMTTAALNKYILETLDDESNPITHSDIQSRSDYVAPDATGHQRSEERFDRTRYLQDRKQKLEVQLPTISGGDCVLSGVRVWIDGFLEGTTDIAMKAVVKKAGGDILPTASRATHILTSQQLSGSKTQRLLTTKSKTKPHVVRPEWVFDSIEAGRRLPERGYSVVHDRTVANLSAMLSTTRPATRPGSVPDAA